MCRAPCYSVTDPRPNIALMAVVREAFPGDCECEDVEENDKADDEKQRMLPLFLSTAVQLPGGTCSMHLFEPRYRLLAQRALDAGGDFAMVWARDGHSFPLTVDPARLVGTSACIVHIERYRQMADGRWNLACRGLSPARIQECWVEEGAGDLMVARLETSADEPMGDDEESTPNTEFPTPSPRENEQGDPAAVAGLGETSSSRSAPARERQGSSGGADANDPPGPGASRRRKREFIREQMKRLGIRPLRRVGDAGAARAMADPTTEQVELPIGEFVWEAAVHLGGPPYGWLDAAEQQAMLEARGVDERLTLLCGLYHRAMERRWSFNAWVSFGLRRWGPLLGALFLAWAASGARSLWP